MKSARDPTDQEEKLAFYAWGANSCGQLSTGNKDDKFLPERCNVSNLNGIQIKKITGGGNHTAVLDAGGNLYVCGSNEKGQLGLGCKNETLILTRSDFPVEVTDVACGWDFTLIVTEDGRLFACGSNAFGQLGIGSVGGCELSFKHVKTITKRVSAVAAGLRHSVALVEGDVYVWGNGRKGQLGQGEYLPKTEAKAKKVLLDGNVKIIGAGCNSCVALKDSDDMYCWGSNEHGQCGFLTSASHKHGQVVLRPSLVYLPEKVRDFSCGWTHVIARGESGKFYGWGRSDYGQLCMSVQSSTMGYSPTPLMDLPGHLNFFSSGAEHNLASGKTSLYTWGWNEHGMCATGGEDNVSKLHLVEYFRDREILCIGCGAGINDVSGLLSTDLLIRQRVTIPGR